MWCTYLHIFAHILHISPWSLGLKSLGMMVTVVLVSCVVLLTVCYCLLVVSRPLFASSQAQWWESRRSSALKEYVLFLITMVMVTGSVERFFSFANYTDSDMVWMTMAAGNLS